MHDQETAPSPTAGPARGPTVARLRPPLVDLAIAGAFVLFSVAEALFSPAVTSPVSHVLLAGAAMAALAWRRSFPVGVAVVVVGIDLAINPEQQFSTLLSLVLVCYTIGAETEPPRSYAGLAVVVLPFVAMSLAAGFVPSDFAAALVFFAGPWTVGSAVRRRVANVEEAVARADRLEREQKTRTAAAAAEERTRIARELHDIVSHSISVVTIQTQAVRRRLGPEYAKEAEDLAAVEATAREALAEMRRLFGVLRSEGESASLTPQPGLHELGRLLAQVRSSGLDVELRVEGEPADLPPGIDLAAYRIVQEALTNALRHSGAQRARVLLRYGSARLDIEVEDEGRGMAAAAASTGGHGLVGVRERVALYDGRVDVGPGPGGGVRLAASLPLREVP